MEKAPNCFRWRFDRLWMVTLSAVILQAILFFLLDRDSSARLKILGTATLICLIQLAAARSQGRTWQTISMTVGMTLFGGVGMALGGLIDSRGGGASCMLCQTHALVTWSLSLMLVFCVVGCRLFIRQTDLPNILRVCGDCLCAISMMGGMFLGEFFFIPISRFGRSDPAVTHGVMLLGMLFGNLAALCLLRLLSSIRLSAHSELLALNTLSRKTDHA